MSIVKVVLASPYTAPAATVAALGGVGFVAASLSGGADGGGVPPETPATSYMIELRSAPDPASGCNITHVSINGELKSSSVVDPFCQQTSF